MDVRPFFQLWWPFWYKRIFSASFAFLWDYIWAQMMHFSVKNWQFLVQKSTTFKELILQTLKTTWNFLNCSWNDLNFRRGKLHKNPQIFLIDCSFCAKAFMLHHCIVVSGENPTPIYVCVLRPLLERGQTWGKAEKREKWCQVILRLH